MENALFDVYNKNKFATGESIKIKHSIIQQVKTLPFNIFHFKFLIFNFFQT